MSDEDEPSLLDHVMKHQRYILAAELRHLGIKEASLWQDVAGGDAERYSMEMASWREQFGRDGDVRPR